MVGLLLFCGPLPAPGLAQMSLVVVLATLFGRHYRRVIRKGAAISMVDFRSGFPTGREAQATEVARVPAWSVVDPSMGA